MKLIEYINTEKEISRFKKESLEKSLSRDSPSTKRLIQIEEEFLQIPFEKIESRGISEIMTAIKIFRDSRHSFYLLYPELSSSSVEVNKKLYPEVIDIFLEKLKNLISEKENKIIEEKSSASDLRRVSREIIIYVSMISLLEKTLLNIKENDLSLQTSEILEEISLNYQSNVFYYYNNSIDIASNFLKSEILNSYVSDVKKMVNLTNEKFDSNELFFCFSNFLVRGKESFGMYLPIRHVGREIAKPFYIKAIFDNENYSPIFSLSSKNVVYPKSNDYYKFLSIKEKSIILENDYFKIKFDKLIKKLYSNKLDNKNFVNLSLKDSIVMIAATRTEDEYLRDVCVQAFKHINHILNN